MTDTDRMVVWLRAAMDAAWRDAEAAPDEQLRAVDTPSGPEVHVGEGDFDGKWSREGQGVDAAYRCDDPYDDCDSARHGYLAEARMLAAHGTRTAVLRRITADRELLAECEAILSDPAMKDYDRDTFGGLLGYRHALAVSLAEVTIRNRAEAWGWKDDQ